MSASPRHRAVDEAAALEALHEMACTDGLPVVIPTQARVDRMVLATCLDGDLVLGEMGPALGACSVEKLAIAAVMAGCTPDHMPVVLAAARAVMDPAFDLTEMQATTHGTAPLVLVNGPARAWCGGIASGYGALGPGYRANASIGRALRLAMINIGGGRPGSSDMALLGHGGKFSYCLAEAEEESPFPGFHTTRGFGPEESAVTVMGAEAPHSVIGVLDSDDGDSTDRFLNSLAGVFANAATNNAALGGGAGMVLLNPGHARALAAAGHTRKSIAETICDRALNSRLDLERTGAAGIAPKKDPLRCFASADDVLIAVAGGGGLYSSVMPTWCAGPHRNRAVSVAIDLDQACEVPASP
ncbi:MAG: hypothetical protein HKP27_10055 [Myxococcales bacterium]|nr:hypothetical protein [Myxococcales bacterium]